LHDHAADIGGAYRPLPRARSYRWVLERGRFQRITRRCDRAWPGKRAEPALAHDRHPDAPVWRLADLDGQPVLIRADRETPYGDVIRVLDLCRQSDIWNIGFATSLDTGT
jgi:hypothetical protein